MLTIFDSSLSLLAFVYGVCLGSFLNVVSLRYIDGQLPAPKLPATIRGRSVCQSCKKTLRWWELVPLISFVALRGRCARCRQAISYQYPLVELLMGAFAWRMFGLYHDRPITLVVTAAIVALLLVLAVIDFKTFLLPDSFILGLVAVTVIAAFYQSYSLTYVIGGIAAAAGFLLLLWILTRGKGIGLGDVKLMIPLGTLFGPWGATVVLFLAFCVGGIVGLYLLARRGATLKTAVPFGPFLIGAALLLLLFPHIPSQLWFVVWG